MAGGVPFVAGVALQQGRPSWIDSSLCTGFALFAGGLAGVFLGVRVSPRLARLRTTLAPLSVALLAGSLGWIGFGEGGLASVVVAMVLGSVVTVALRRTSGS